MDYYSIFSIICGSSFTHVSTSRHLLYHCRTILLKEGVEKLIRKAKAIHGSCKSAATDALRDLGLDNYNA
jgi:hypothetical protein